MTNISFEGFGLLIFEILNRIFGQFLLRLYLHEVHILLREKRSVRSVFWIDFRKNIPFGRINNVELFHGIVFGHISDSILRYWILIDIFKKRACL